MSMASQFAGHPINGATMGLSGLVRVQDGAVNQPAPMNLLSDGMRFELRASADRSTFFLRSKRDFFEANLEGKQAARFDAAYQALRRQRPTEPVDETLWRLWTEGGYMWFAAQDAD